MARAKAKCGAVMTKKPLRLLKDETDKPQVENCLTSAKC